MPNCGDLLDEMCARKRRQRREARERARWKPSWGSEVMGRAGGQPVKTFESNSKK